MSKSMNEDNKVVVKVKYQGLNQEQKFDTRPDMVTEWHIQRIVGAVAILIVFILLPFYFFSGDSSELANNLEPKLKIIEKKAINNEMVKQVVKVVEPVAKPFIKFPNPELKKQQSIIAEPIENITKETAIVVESPKEIKKELTIEQVEKPKVLTNKKIIRALLTTGLNNKEPIDNIRLPIKVSNDKASGIYYYTEIIDMKGQALYHHWFRNDKLVYKRKINILGNRWRAATSKLIPYSKAGDWTVRLVNMQGVILNEIKFEVIK